MADDRTNPPDDGENPEKNPKPYKVGPGRPPREHQFKKGESGNRSGKRKPPPSYADLLNRILSEPTSAEENGRTISLIRAKAWAKSLVHFGALVGDPVYEDILLMFEKPWESAPIAGWEFRLVDGEDDIPPEPKSKRST